MIDTSLRVKLRVVTPASRTIRHPRRGRGLAQAELGVALLAGQSNDAASARSTHAEAGSMQPTLDDMLVRVVGDSGNHTPYVAS
jgi:hypothetical protein